MNKKSFKIIFIFILMFICISSISAINIDNYEINSNNYYDYKNEKTGYLVVIEDDASLLNQSEIDKLKEEMKPLTQHGNIAFKTLNSNYTSTGSYASSYYSQIFGSANGTIFLIDMDNREIYIYSNGNNYLSVTTDKANIITDNVYKYASREQYYECASKAFSQINSVLKGEKIQEPMRYISNILISISIALLINFMIVLINSKIRRAKDKDILSNCNIKFNIGEIKGRKIGTHSVYSPRESSSSSSGGGSFGGGGSSGGGGGHRF